MQPRNASNLLVFALLQLGLGCADHSSGPERPLSGGPLQFSLDVGDVGATGAAKWKPNSDSDLRGAYELSGAGGDIWLHHDAMHFAHSRRSGDLNLQATVQWLEPSDEAHRKAVLMVRASTAADAAYVDVATHNNGLTSLQYRPHAGAPTVQLVSSVRGAKQLKLVRQGRAFTATFTGLDGQADSIGPLEVDLGDSVLMGLGVCSHDKGTLTQARFDQVVMDGTVSGSR